MGPNSFRNLTYAAVLAVVGALVYLVYQSSKRKQKLNPSVESTSTLGGYVDTLGSIAGSSTAALSMDSIKSSVDGDLLSKGSISEPSVSSYDKKSAASEVKEVTIEDGIKSSKSTGPDDGIASSEKKPTVTSKGIKSPASKSAPAKVKFDDGETAGEFMVIAGSFASKDNAEALVAKLKKIGFSHSEAVKMENSANTYTVAGYYKFKGGADAAVRTLKANKVAAIVKKKSGEIYKASSPTAPVKPVATPKSVVSVKAKPI